MPEPASYDRLRLAIVGIGLLGCAALVASQLGGYHGAAIAAKFTASTSFVVLAISVGAMRSLFGRLLLTGFLLSWIGDMLLLGRTQALFLSGLCAFLLAHLAYVSAFVARGINWRWVAAAAIPVALISALVSAWLSPHVPDSMQLAVRLYTVVISCMVISAIGTRDAGVAIPVGALLFYFSDLSVAAGQFLQPAFPNFVWGLPFYYGGQLLLAGSASPPLPARQSAGASDSR